MHFYLCVYACVWICSSLLGTLSILTQKLCLHFHFPSPAGPSPNLPWQLLSTRQAWSPPTLCPMPPRYAPDASQLVCRLCGAGRLLETDARATVGPFLRICVIGQPWALTVTFTAGIDSGKECGVSAAQSSVQVPTALVVIMVPVFTISSVKVTNWNSRLINSTGKSGDLGQPFYRTAPETLKCTLKPMFGKFLIFKISICARHLDCMWRSSLFTLVLC